MTHPPGGRPSAGRWHIGCDPVTVQWRGLRKVSPTSVSQDPPVMKIAVVGHLKFPIAKPFCGGLEMFTHALVQRLVRRGHDVTLFASADSDRELPVEAIIDRSTIAASRDAFGREDHGWIEAAEDEAYEGLMSRLTMSDFDVVHNNSISPVPLAFAEVLPMPMMTTLHVPVLPRLRDVLEQRGGYRCGRFINISRSNARKWRGLLPQQDIVHNGVDCEFWKSCDDGPRQRRAVWFGRILADKGTHYAIDAAHRAGLPIDIIGPIADEEYFESSVRPMLRDDDVFHGHQSHEEICRLVGSAAVSLVTPCWDEPFGLVVAESLACGTPVAAFDRGAIRELVPRHCGRVVAPGHTAALSCAIRRCLELSNDDCRRHARNRFSLTRMLDEYESVLTPRRVAVAA